MTKALRQVGLAVLVILAMNGVWQAAAQVEVKTERPKWEYTTVGEGHAMNQLGEKGWELVAVSKVGESDRLYFKRPK